MKRSGMGHTKLKKLAKRLSIPSYAAVGLLECLWHLTAREAMRGDIGKLSDEDISIGLDWDGGDAELVAALVDTGWIDRHAVHRLVIHDWHDHADGHLHAELAKKTLLFATGYPPRVPHDAFNSQTRARIKKEYLEKYGIDLDSPGPVEVTGGASPGPVPDDSGTGPKKVPSKPKPVPVPKPVPKPSSQGEIGARGAESDREDPWAQFCRDYPGPIRPGEDALRTFLALPPGDQVLAADRAGAYRRLVEAEGREPRFVSKPGNWLNRRGWLEDMTPSPRGPSGGRSAPPQRGGDPQLSNDELIAEANKLRAAGAIYGQ